MRFCKKRHTLRLCLSLTLFGALVVGLAGAGSAAQAHDCAHSTCPTTGRAGTGAAVKLNHCVGSVCPATENIHPSVRYNSSVTVSFGPVTINGGHTIKLTGFDQQIPFSFVVYINNGSVHHEENWKLTASSPGVHFSLSGGSVREHLILPPLTPVAVTCFPSSFAGCTNGLSIATEGDLSSPQGVVLVQTARPQKKAGSFIVRVDGLFLFPADAYFRF
jgi:hypothetical protein